MKAEGVELPDELVINIITRLPLQIIVRFKLVCRDWKLLTESAFFRNLYQSSSSTATSCWSILHGSYKCTTSYLEKVELNLPHESSHGNSRNWSFASGVIRKYTQKNLIIKEIWVVACADGLVLLRLFEEDMTKHYYIGNPVLSQWIQLSSPPYLPQYHYFIDSGLVTHMDSGGALLGYKVVQLYTEDINMTVSLTWTFKIYSSNTGDWRVQHVSCPGRYTLSCHTSNPVSLNGKLHWFDEYQGRIIVHDFFSHDDQVRAIPLPALMEDPHIEHQSCINFCPSPCKKMICTTSQGYFVFIEAGLVDEVKSYNVKVWRLKNDSWDWEKAWEINMACVDLGVKCVPMAINYFDIDIIYLWDLKRKCFIACNLRTHTISHGTHQHGAPYKEDTWCFESRSSISQFVPSLQVIPI